MSEDEFLDNMTPRKILALRIGYMEMNGVNTTFDNDI